MEVTITTRLTRLTERLAELREEEHQTYQAIYGTKPYSPDHLQAHGKWMAARARREEVQRLIDEEKGD